MKVEQSNTGPKKTVMIVEDDADIREALQMILEGEGYHILLAKNGQEGLNVVQNTHTVPNLILLDLQMPVMSGQDFLKNLRAKDTTALSKIPVVILSAARAELNELEANDRLPKPVDVDRLMGIVEKFCISTQQGHASEVVHEA